jgi:glycosyltransferase involved in cell wall biosynthesis
MIPLEKQVHPLVSIITPSYNQASFLEKTIRSVLGQDYPEIEYIVVDGASTDGSVEIIERYQDKLAWWISEKDAGQAEAINKGFRRARGEILAWLNSDDIYAPGAVGRAVEILQKRPEVFLVFGNAVSIDETGRPFNDQVFGHRDFEDLAAFKIICQPTVFFRKEALDKAGFLDPTYHLLLDHHLWLRIAALGPLAHVPEVLAFARYHPGAKNVRQAADFGQEAYRIREFLKSQPELAKRLQNCGRKVSAGSHKLNARYLLDGGFARSALRSYFLSFKEDPGTALQEWHRMLFALLSMVGGRGLGKMYYNLRRQRLPDSIRQLELENVERLYEKV